MEREQAGKQSRQAGRQAGRQESLSEDTVETDLCAISNVVHRPPLHRGSALVARCCGAVSPGARLSSYQRVRHEQSKGQATDTTR